MSGQISRKAFTLIELLIVLAIIGILGTIVTLGVATALARARDGKKIANLNEIKKAVQAYYAAHGYYPNVAAGGSCATQTCVNGDGYEALKTILGDENLMNNLPPTSDGYRYCSSETSNSQEYVLRVPLEAQNQILDATVDFDGTFYSHWSCDDIGCQDGTKNFCLAVCENIPGQEGAADNSMYPPHCGYY